MQKNEFVVCNCCGRKFFVQPDKNEMEIVHVEKEWGYFSRKDTTRHIFDLCEECYDKWILEFKIPVEEKESWELL